jgi:hypothetical protein
MEFPSGDATRSVVVADLNGDTIPDLVTDGDRAIDHDEFPDGEEFVSVLIGNGDGTFQGAAFVFVGDR